MPGVPGDESRGNSRRCSPETDLCAGAHRGSPACPFIHERSVLKSHRRNAPYIEKSGSPSPLRAPSLSLFHLVESCRIIIRRGVCYLASISQISVRRVHRSGQSNLLKGVTSSYSETTGCQTHSEFLHWKSKSFSKA